MSWLITTRPPSWPRRNPRSQVIESASRWLVGSSSSSVVSEPRRPVRGREQDAGEFDPAALAAGQRAQRLVEHPVGQPEAVADPRRLALGGVPAERREPVLEPAVPADGLVALASSTSSAIGDLRLLHVPQQRSRPRADSTRSLRGHGRGRPRAGPAAGSRASPRADDGAGVGPPSPASTRRVVVLPAPLRPTRPMRSPGWTRRVAPDSRMREPARSSRSVAVIHRAPDG